MSICAKPARPLTDGFPGRLMDLYRSQGEGVRRLIGYYPGAFQSFGRMEAVARLAGDRARQAEAAAQLGSSLLRRAGRASKQQL